MMTENLSLSMLILAGKQTRGLRKESMIIILEKWSKVFFFFYSSSDHSDVVIMLGRCLVASLVSLLRALKLILLHKQSL